MIFNSKKLVILVSRGKFKVGFVVLSDPPHLENLTEFAWLEENLTAVLNSIKQKYKVNSVRLVIDDDLSYVLEMEIPLKVDQEKDFISQKLTEIVPEVLLKDDWDFVEKSRTKESRKIVIFAPVKASFQVVSQAMNKAGLTVEAVEPAGLAIQRNANALIGIALKKDLQGKDEQVLNLVTNKRKFNFKILYKVLIIVLLLGGLLAGGFLFSRRKISNSSITSFPSPVPTVNSVPTLMAEKNKSVLKIQILNGNGQAGVANVAKKYLEGLGYGNIQTGNAGSYDYLKTVVSFKSTEDLTQNLITDLSKEYSVTTNSAILANDSPFDVIIILGRQ